MATSRFNGESRRLIRKYFCGSCEKIWRIETMDIGNFAETINFPDWFENNCGHLNDLKFKGTEYSDPELKKSPAASRTRPARTLIRSFSCSVCEMTWKLRTADAGSVAETLKRPIWLDEICGHNVHQAFDGFEFEDIISH